MGNAFTEDPKLLKEVNERFKDKLTGAKGIMEKISLETRYAKQLRILKSPKLLDKFNKEFDKTIIGEHQTRKTVFLSLCSIWVRNSKSKLNTLVNSESSAGKSYVCKRIYDIFPEHLKQYRTKISAEAFTYWHNSSKEPDWTWDGKICYLEDIKESVINSDTFKIMCSEGSIATVVRNQMAIDIFIKGKPIILVTTATAQPTGEILNRFNLIPLDETKEQTKKILEYQSIEAMGGLDTKYDEKLSNSLTLLQRVKVIIPYAKNIFHHFPKEALRIRRDYVRFLDLIKSSAALYQYQREEDELGRIIAEKQDYENARACLSCFEHKGVFGLPTRLRKAYDVCLKLGKFMAKDVYSNAPFVNQKMWYTYLDDLTRLHLIKVELVPVEGVKKPVREYSTINTRLLNIPEFERLNVLNVLNLPHLDLQEKPYEKPKKRKIVTTFNTLPTFNTINTINTINNKEEKEGKYICWKCNRRDDNIDYFNSSGICKECEDGKNH